MTEIDHNTSITLDVHAHLVPALPQRIAYLAGADWDTKLQSMAADGLAIGPELLFQPGRLIAWMDANQIRHAWISIPPPAYRPRLDETSARDWVRYVNDGLVEIAEGSSGRLSALFHLPVEHPALAAEIASSCGRKFSMSAGGGPQIRLSDPLYEPLWSALDAQSAFLFIHPGATCDPRLDRYFLRNLFGNPVETGVAASHLVLGGVLERNARMTVCLAHGGGVLPAVAGRMDHGHSTGSVKDAAIQDAPARILRRFCVDCITHSLSTLRLAGDIFGEDRIYFGSDWPFPMGLMNPHGQLASLGPAFRKRMLETNPTELLAQFDAQLSDGR